MTDQTKNVTSQKFSKLLDSYTYEKPRKGQFYDAEIVMIDNDRILLDLGGKMDGIVPRRELQTMDEEELDKLNVGDIVPVYVNKGSNLFSKPMVSIQKGAEKKDWESAQSLLVKGGVTELEIIGKNKGGLLVKFGRLKGFIPASLTPIIARMRKKSLKEKIKRMLVGRTIYAMPIQVRPQNNKLVFSVRDASDVTEERVFDQISEGDHQVGIIVSLEDYGAFVNLNGVDGLLHISNMSEEKIDHPSDFLEIGDEVQVRVISIDREKKHISLELNERFPSSNELEVNA
jgi:small subunit ribosomal protein S1